MAKGIISYSSKVINNQISILKKAIREMLNLETDLLPFEKKIAKRYSTQIKLLFINIIAGDYLKIKNFDLDILCKESLHRWNRIDYFIKPKQNSVFQQAFYNIKPDEVALMVGCSIYLLAFENLLALFEDNTMISIFADLKNKKGINIRCPISAYTKIKILKRFDKQNCDFLKFVGRNLRNKIAHFDFEIGNKEVVYNRNKINKIGLRKKTLKLLWLSHITLLNKDLAIREWVKRSKLRNSDLEVTL